MKHVQTKDKKTCGHIVNIPIYYTCIYTTIRRTRTLHTPSFQSHQKNAFFSLYQ